MNTLISPNLLFNNLPGIFYKLKYTSFEDKLFLKDTNLILNIKESEDYYFISGLFENFNNYNIELNYVNNFLIVDFFNKTLYKNNTINILNNYGTFRRMLYLENINVDNIHVNFNNDIFEISIKKLL